LIVGAEIIGALEIVSEASEPADGCLTSPIIFTLRFSNSSLSFANAPSSVVHTGVKSAGCEKRIAQLPSMNLWNSISPCVVFAVKFGAMKN
jgi:hypothetical protein